MALIKIYALFTIRKQRWLTRQVAVEDGEVVRTAEPAEETDVRAFGAGTDAGGGGTVTIEPTDERRDERVTTSRPTSRMGSTWARRALVGVLSAALLFAVPSGVALAAQPSPSGSGQSQSDSGSSGSGSSGPSRSGSGSSGSEQSGSSSQARAARPRRRRRPTRLGPRHGRPQPRPRPGPSGPSQQAAAAAQRGRASWESHGRPNQMIIVRRTSVDSLTNGEVTRRTPRVSSAVNLASLDNAVPSGWITTDGGTLRLAATVVLSPGVTLEVGGGGVTNVQLVGGSPRPGPPRPSTPAAAR